MRCRSSKARGMEEVKEQYIRVGTTLYKIVQQPLANGTTIILRIPWNFGTIRQDYGKNYTPPIKKYDGFCTVPSHTDYHKEIDGFFNLYEPIGHVPVEGEFPHIEQLVQHIFGGQYELGMDYLQLLFTQPIQKLPILMLVSEERNTGKTTFLNFLKAVFQDNATFNTNEDFRSQFNADWAGKLLIMVDEVLLSRREDSERLKNLSTAQTYKVEAKGKDRQEVTFFAKFVLCSNNELSPVIIDPDETRYWVRKVERLESDDTNFLQKLKEQIPAFLYALQHRTLSSTKESRMWFAPSIIRTEALERIIQCNRNHTEIELVELLRNIMELRNVDKVSFIAQDLLPLLVYNGVKVEIWQIRKVVKELWRLTPAPNALSYTTYQIDFTTPFRYGTVSRVGRYYTVTKEFLDKVSI